jgi:KDO2-lipid IV(A) lauroyltransferase
MVTYLLFLIASIVIPRLPERFSYRLASLAGDVLAALPLPNRAAVEDNLRHVLGPNVTKTALKQTVREVYRNACRNYVDLFRIPHVRLEDLERQVLIQGEHYFDHAYLQGRGVIVATMHLGNFSLLVQMAARRNLPMMVLVEPLRPERLFRLVAGLRASKGLIMMPATPGGVKAAIRVLKEGGLVGIATDRDLQHNGITVDFCGSPTRLPIGAIELAQRTGAALLPAFGPRLGFRRYAIMIEPAIELPQPRPGERRADIVPLALQHLAAVNEVYLRRFPGQWVVFERIWPPAEPVRLEAETIEADAAQS